MYLLYGKRDSRSKTYRSGDISYLSMSTCSLSTARLAFIVIFIYLIQIYILPRCAIPTLSNITKNIYFLSHTHTYTHTYYIYICVCVCVCVRERGWVCKCVSVYMCLWVMHCMSLRNWFGERFSHPLVIQNSINISLWSLRIGFSWT